MRWSKLSFLLIVLLAWISLWCSALVYNCSVNWFSIYLWVDWGLIIFSGSIGRQLFCISIGWIMPLGCPINWRISHRRIIPHQRTAECLSCCEHKQLVGAYVSNLGVRAIWLTSTGRLLLGHYVFLTALLICVAIPEGRRALSGATFEVRSRICVCIVSLERRYITVAVSTHSDLICRHRIGSTWFYVPESRIRVANMQLCCLTRAKHLVFLFK